MELSLELPATDWRRVAGVVSLGVGLQVLVFGLLFPHLWYGLHAITDIDIYQGYAQTMAHGFVPYRDFPVEYPPLALPMFCLPWYHGATATYTTWFSVEMFVLTLFTAATVCTIALRLWPRGRSPYAAAVLFALACATTGAILENRYDAAVALVIALFLLFLVEQRLIPAAVMLGLGFALKLTPLALLPLVLLFARRRGQAAWAAIAFGVAAALPFVPYALLSPSGVGHVFAYHLKRPLQIESVLGTPFLIGKILGRVWVEVGFSHGSHEIIATGAQTAATLSGLITVAAVVATFILIFRRRQFVLQAPRVLPTALYSVLLAVMVGSKVLSPQYVIWTLPVVALVAIDDRLLGGLSFLVLVLTQLEFPSNYGRLIGLEGPTLALVAARNLLLVVTFGVALYRLATLPDEHTPAACRLAETPAGNI